MSIKPDHWIRRMAIEHAMIEPFVERQVRQGVVSYGLSSYGYDIRVADEYRIFTSATGQLTVVDPKQIDERAMVYHHGEICIIPPNSFALARTVEYFRIPRNVLTICLGKSTYARCFRGDTRVALVDGTAPTLEEMARRHEEGELFWGYSIGVFGQVMQTLLQAPRYIGQDTLLELILDNSAIIHCTPDHEFIRRDGSMCMADELRPHDALMPLYRQRNEVREQVYQPAQDLFYMNHRIVRIRALPGSHDVYCLTVPEAGNFALEAGVFTSNCGIIVNVTPFEPEWEGHVTIEISNTTPLPAKIYSNEGIAQVLFFEGDPPEVSYADRKGKYQAQRGITLPKL